MKTKIFLPLLLVVLSLISVSANAATNDRNITKETAAGMTQEQKDARMEAMKQRVQEIKDTDKSQFTRIDRKETRQELKDMNKEAKEMGHGGVCLSIAGILIIILVLILIL